MRVFLIAVKRNITLYFKDKGAFFGSLIAPLILILLFATFLKNVYINSFLDMIPENMDIPQSIAEGFVGGWVFSSLLAVSCITVAFCSNMIMVMDKVSGARLDFMVTPVKKSTLAFGYYAAALMSTLIICLIALTVCLIYLSIVGWYITVLDIVLTVLDIILLVMFGTVLSSIVNVFISTQGQISAVSTIISSCYGFLCGAYMPMSQFSEGLRDVLSVLPGTYGTALLHDHLTRSVLAELENNYHFSAEAVNAIRDGFDCNAYFFGSEVSSDVMYIILGATVAVLMFAYIILHRIKSKRPVSRK